jgi:hypothetical protein
MCLKILIGCTQEPFISNLTKNKFIYDFMQKIFLCTLRIKFLFVPTPSDSQLTANR